MAKFKVYNCEIDSEDIIKGALIGAGVAFLALGIKNLFDARRIRKEFEEPLDEDEEFDEFEEYLLEKEEMAYTKMNRCTRRGIFGIAAGSAIAAVAALSFTPYKRVILESDAVESIKNADVIGRIKDAEVVGKIRDAEVIDRIKNIDVVDRIKEAEVIDKIKGVDVSSKVKAKNADVISKLKEAQIVQRIAEINTKDAIKNIKKLEKNVDNLKAISDTIEKVKERLA